MTRIALKWLRAGNIYVAQREHTAMTYRGRVKDGVVVPEEGADLPEGAEVRIDVTPEDDGVRSNDGAAPLPSLAERMKKVAGLAKGLPADFAINHDHYLHGQPKRQ